MSSVMSQIYRSLRFEGTVALEEDSYVLYALGTNTRRGSSSKKVFSTHPSTKINQER